jgi:hypothetical protein
MASQFVRAVVGGWPTSDRLEFRMKLYAALLDPIQCRMITIGGYFGYERYISQNR